MPPPDGARGARVGAVQNARFVHLRAHGRHRLLERLVVECPEQRRLSHATLPDQHEARAAPREDAAGARGAKVRLAELRVGHRLGSGEGPDDGRRGVDRAGPVEGQPARVVLGLGAFREGGEQGGESVQEMWDEKIFADTKNLKVRRLDVAAVASVVVKLDLVAAAAVGTLGNDPRAPRFGVSRVFDEADRATF